MPSAKKYLPNGQGAIVGFGIKGGKESWREVDQQREAIQPLANIGDAKSLIIHPATTTHSQLNESGAITDGRDARFVRLSIGIEDVADIIADLARR